MMRLIDYINKAFVGGYWMVGIRDKTNSTQRFEIVKPNKDQWLADPFIIENQGHHYLFVEQYLCQKNRAGIGVYEIKDGIPVNNELIIDNPFHMSYPCVFQYKGVYYMIPESSSNQSLDVYKASSFPYKWEHVISLIEGRRVVDTTVFLKEDDIYLLSYEKAGKGWNLITYILEMDTMSLRIIAETHYRTNVGRPAGKLFQKDGALYRPAQNCSTKYGESLYIYKVTRLDHECYTEQLVDEIKARDILMDVRFQRIHTINSDSRYVVVDVFHEQFNLFRWWKIIKRQYFQK